MTVNDFIQSYHRSQRITRLIIDFESWDRAVMSRDYGEGLPPWMYDCEVIGFDLKSPRFPVVFAVAESRTIYGRTD